MTIDSSPEVRSFVVQLLPARVQRWVGQLFWRRRLKPCLYLSCKQLKPGRNDQWDYFKNCVFAQVPCMEGRSIDCLSKFCNIKFAICTVNKKSTLKISGCYSFQKLPLLPFNKVVLLWKRLLVITLVFSKKKKNRNISSFHENLLEFHTLNCSIYRFSTFLSKVGRREVSWKQPINLFWFD